MEIKKQLKLTAFILIMIASVISSCAKEEQEVIDEPTYSSNYYVNKNAQSDGTHKIHTSGCSHAPDAANRIHLGNFDSCHKAITEARNHYDKVSGCYYCSRDCY